MWLEQELHFDMLLFTTLILVLYCWNSWSEMQSSPWPFAIMILGIIFSYVSIIRLENKILQLKGRAHSDFVLRKLFQILVIIIHERTY